jgi:protocatechuate 3,4-dioxygenase beta subunit
MAIDQAHPHHDHDRGLAFDLGTMLGRRRMLALVAGAGVATLVGCGSSGSDAASSTTTAAAGSSTTAASGSAGTSDAIPEETAGPYPGDGTNGVNVLTESGIVRSDLRSSFGTYSGTAAGIDTTVTLRVLDAATGEAMGGAAVYLWHADQEGLYSLYTKADQNYLRGVQEAGSDGTVSFTTAFPGAYDGRWPHMHFEVYPSLAEATAAGTPVRTSQLAIPEDTCNLVYATAGYEQSVANMTRTSLASDMVFSDGADRQLPAVAGSVSQGFTLSLDVPV